MKSVAEKKKSKNIAEYLIYMYQIEDLIRSYQGNKEEIRHYVIAHYPISEEEKEQTASWFEELTDRMKSEKVFGKGHLSELTTIVAHLSQLHWKLLKFDSLYFKTYAKAKPFIVEAVMQAGDEPLGTEIQICLNGVYGLLICRLTGKQVADEQLKSAEAYGEVLSLLNVMYQQERISRN